MSGPAPTPGRSATPAELSLPGEDRRQRDYAALLAELSAVRTKVRRRRAVTAGIAMSVLALTAVLIWLPLRTPAPAGRAGDRPIVIDPGAQRPPPVPIPTPRNAGAPEVAEPRVTVVQNDPTIVERFRVSPDLSRVAILDDDGLLKTLHAAGIKAGLVRTAAGVTVTGLPPAKEHQGGPPAIPGI